MGTIWSLPKHDEDGGKVRITNRYEPCGCGCGGKDSWHAAHFARVVRNITYFDHIEERKTKAAGTCRAIARGVVKLPQGEAEVVFVVTDENYPLGWFTTPGYLT